MASANSFSRRRFLLGCGAAGPFLLQLQAGAPAHAAGQAEVFKPLYRSQSPLSSVLQKTDPAKDVFPTEIIADDVGRILLAWRRALMKREPDWRTIARSLNARFKGSRLSAGREAVQRAEGTLRIWRRHFEAAPQVGPVDFIAELSNDFRGARILWAEFKITSVENSGPGARTLVRYDLVHTAEGYHREQRSGWMELTWAKDAGKTWEVTEWRALNEQCSRSTAPMFQEITFDTLGDNSSFRDQLAKGTDYWRTVLDGACGIDIYGNYGVAAGDFDDDGWDDLYVCQPAGLPNRLYKNRGDGTFEDVTGEAGVGVIDSSPMALFADVDNDGR
ncbi:MAG: FG-GAP-like repeat-containing protein, partial [Terriglobia bacterium]